MGNKMKNYRITVNGTMYDVLVEEVSKNNETPQTVPLFNAPPILNENINKISEVSSNTTISSPMPGKILSVRVKEGQKVKKGEVLLMLEAMKMENEIVAPEDGIVISVPVNEGMVVETGATLVKLN